MKKTPLYAALSLLSAASFSATTDVSIVNSSYTSVTCVASNVTFTKPTQYVFASSQPASSLAGHKFNGQLSVPIAALGSGVCLYAKSEDPVAVAAVSTLADVTINNGATGGGGGGGGDASAANQVLQINLATTSDASLESLDVKTPVLVGGKVPVTAVVTSMPTTAVTGTFWQATQPVSNTNIDVALSTRLKPSDTLAAVTTVGTITNPVTVTGTITSTPSGTQAVSAASLPLPSGASTAAKQPALGVAGTASSDVITVQGIASMTALKVDGSAVTQPVSVASLPLPSGAATSVNQSTELTRIGDITETAPSTDTGSSGLNGRLQRIAQQLTALGSVNPSSLGQQTSANSLGVVLASNQSSVATKQGAVVVSDISGTITTGGTAQTISAPQAANQTYLIANVSTTNEMLWINFLGGTAAPNAAGSMPLHPQTGMNEGGFISFTTDKAVSVFAATTGHVFTAMRVAQ